MRVVSGDALLTEHSMRDGMARGPGEERLCSHCCPVERPRHKERGSLTTRHRAALALGPEVLSGVGLANNQTRRG